MNSKATNIKKKFLYNNQKILNNVLDVRGFTHLQRHWHLDLYGYVSYVPLILHHLQGTIYGIMDRLLHVDHQLMLRVAANDPHTENNQSKIGSIKDLFWMTIL